MKDKNKRYEKRQEWSKPRISKLGLHLTKGGSRAQRNENKNFYTFGGAQS